jgi:hypothetical protein
MALDFEKNNQDIRNWGADAVNQMQAIGSAMQITHRSDSPSSSASLPKMKDRYRTRQGSIDLVSIKFPRSLIWTMKGAGKGRAGITGSKWTDKYNNTKSTNPNSFGKAGTSGRTAKPFINNVLDGPRGIDELATIVATNTGDAVIANLFVK